MAPPPVKKPSYRVLEDPFEVPTPAVAATAPSNNPTTASTSGKRAPSYRVLEDPMTTAIYDPATSSGNEGPTGNTVSNRPLASEVLEGAREKFDKFWGSKSRAPNAPGASAAATAATSGGDSTHEP